MSLKERIYKILLISSRDTFSSSFEALLPPTRYQLSYTATSINSAKQILTEHSFDFVIINSSSYRRIPEFDSQWTLVNAPDCCSSSYPS